MLGQKISNTMFITTNKKNAKRNGSGKRRSRKPIKKN